jgi:hypothetical protein
MPRGITRIERCGRGRAAEFWSDLLAKGRAMATGTKPSARLGDKELQKLLELIKGADSVELKLTVPEQDQRSTVRALGLDPLQAQIRQVFFLDTPELALDQHGLVVRARRSQKKGDDSVVKLRPVVPSELPRAVRRSQASGSRLTRRQAGSSAPGRTGRSHASVSLPVTQRCRLKSCAGSIPAASPLSYAGSELSKSFHQALHIQVAPSDRPTERPCLQGLS